MQLHAIRNDFAAHRLIRFANKLRPATRSGSNFHRNRYVGDPREETRSNPSARTRFVSANLVYKGKRIWNATRFDSKTYGHLRRIDLISEFYVYRYSWACPLSLFQEYLVSKTFNISDSSSDREMTVINRSRDTHTTWENKEQTAQRSFIGKTTRYCPTQEFACISFRYVCSVKTREKSTWKNTTKCAKALLSAKYPSYYLWCIIYTQCIRR